MRDQALGVAEIIADADEPERVLETERRLLAALDLEGDQRRAAAHLLLHDRRLRMIGPAGIDQARNLRMLASATATVAALSVCRRTRTASVSRPFSSTQALNGDSDGPVWRIKIGADLVR